METTVEAVGTMSKIARKVEVERGNLDGLFQSLSKALA